MSDNNDGNHGGGVGASYYYGGIAIALCLVIVLTLVSRILYRRRVRNRLLRANRQERITLRERGEAPGLPTYRESRNQPSLPRYTAEAEYAPPPGPPPPSGSPDNEGHHFHFHFPSLHVPQALHLRPRQANDPADQIPTVPPPSYEPPKYEPPTGAPPQSEADARDGPVASGSAEHHDQDLGEHTAVATAAASQPAPEHSGEHAEHRNASPLQEQTQGQGQGQQQEQDYGYDDADFIHPEERRRIEAAQRNDP